MATTTDLGAAYRKQAADGRLGAKEKQGCKLLADADGHFCEEGVEEALHKAKQALDIFKDTSYKAGLPDATRLIVHLMACQGKKEAACKLAKDELSKFRSSGDKVAEAKMLLSISELNFSKQGKDVQEAVASATEAQGLFRSQGSPALEAAALVAQSAIELHREGDEKRNAKEAATLATKAKELSIQAGDKRGEAAALHTLAETLAMEGAFQEALTSADEALDLYLELHNKSGEASELLALAKWHLKSGKPRKALSDAEEALEIYQTLNSSKEKDALTVVFESYVAKGNLSKAQRVATRSLNKYQESGDKQAEGEALSMLVKLHSENGKFEEALSAAERAVVIFQDMGAQKMEAKMASKILELHLELGNHAQALQSGEDAMTLLKDIGEPEEKVDAMFIMMEAHLRNDSKQDALDLVTEMRNHFQESGDKKSEASALMGISSIQMLLEGFDQAVGAATRAQAIFSEDGDPKNEGNALCMLSDAHARKKEYKMAVKAAERARAVFKELGEQEGEAASLYRMASNSTQLAVQEGARVVQKEVITRAAKDALDKGSKAADTALRLSRQLLAQGNQELLGCVLCAQSQFMMFQQKFEDALKASDEAVVLFREIGSDRSEADALLLSADALRMTKAYQESRDAANESLSLYQKCNDERGEEQVTTLIGYLEEIQQRMQQQWMAQQMAQNPNMFQQQQEQMPMMNMFAPQEMGGMPDQATSLARVERERGPALDIAGGLDEAMVKSKVMEIATRITGADDGEIEADTPLMEAGLTSNSAILLRDELSQDLPGISLPVTLVFDYPSISAMAELIVESAQKSIKK